MDLKNALDLYITVRNYFNKGWSEISWLRQPAERLVALALLLNFAKPDFLLMLLLVVGFVVFCVACFFIGWWWDKNKAFNLENDWNYQRSGLKHLVKKR